MIKTEDYGIFEHNVSTLKDTSKDNHDGTDYYMTESSLAVVNFDHVKDEYIRDLSLCENPRSNDALFIHPDGKMVFIEFKNGFMDRGKCFDVRGKIFDSMLIVTDIINKGISYTRENIDYILVYNQESNFENTINCPSKHVQESKSRDEIGKRLMALGGGDQIKFGLERFKKYCFKNVFTYTEKEFQEHFVSSYTI